MTESRNSANLVLICLAILYSGLSALALGRVCRTYKRLKITKYAKLFYISLCTESILRALTFTSIVIDLNRIEYNTLFLLISLPDSIFIILYLLLLIITMIIYYHSHIVSSLSIALIKKAAPKRSKFIIAALSTILSLMILQFASYLAFLIDSLTSVELSKENAIINIIIPSLGALYIFYLDFVFSGVPTRSPYWRSNLRKVCVISIFWTISRIIKGSLDLVDESSIVDVVNAVVNPEKGSVTLLKSALCIAVVIVAELVCMFLVLDYGFLGIFLQEEENDPETSPSRIPVSSLVSSNPFIKESDVHILQGLSNTKQKALGKVFKAEFNSSEVFYRVITFTRLSSYIIEEISLEIESYKTLSVPGIVPILGIYFKSSTVGLVYPYYPRGSLHDLLHNSAPLSRNRKLSILQAIAESLQEIHLAGRVHGHLTSHNILFDDDQHPLISDLGFHKMKKYAGVMYEYTYKSAWSSPELLLQNKMIPQAISSSDDCYSFGMICWEVFTQQVPFQGYSRAQLSENVAKNSYRPLIPKEVPEDIAKMIKSCWNREPGKRPEMSLVVMAFSSHYSELL